MDYESSHYPPFLAYIPSVRSLEGGSEGSEVGGRRFFRKNGVSE